MIANFDNLNNIEHEKKAKKRNIEPIELYFEEMDISEEQKDNRKVLAFKLEDVFLFMFALCILEKQMGSMGVNGIVDEVYSRYIDCCPRSDNSSQSLVRQNCVDMVNSTLDNMGDATEVSNDNWWVSPDRATFLSENESNTVYNNYEYDNAIENGLKYKVWHTEADKYVRDTHKPLNGAEIGIDELFLVGNSLMRFPKDTEYDADASEITNCRCSVEYF